MMGEKSTGLTRLFNATVYSLEGFKSAWRTEAAFRQELCVLAVAIPLGIWLGHNGMERALLISSVMMVLVIELLNSALEAVVDRVGPDFHPLAKRTKDYGSAAVLTSILIAMIIWAAIIF
ncbi:diacylglycerol kinase [Desulfobacula sp.]